MKRIAESLNGICGSSSPYRCAGNVSSFSAVWNNDEAQATNATPSDSGSDPVGPPAPPAAPDVRIADGGRLSIDADSLREGEVLAIGLGLADEARGEEPVTVRIVSVDGRRRETTATPARGSGSGLRLEIDPEWLTPGRYMIEVSTAEKTHFPVRRYVLEVL